MATSPDRAARETREPAPPDPVDTLTPAEARALAVAAQMPPRRGGGDARAPHTKPGPPELRTTGPRAETLARLVQRLGALQMDSVAAVVRAHYLPAFSRLGAYDRDRLDGLARGRDRALFEYWGHEASLLPVQDHPLFRWRMADAEAGVGIYGRIARFQAERPDTVARVLERVRAEGPVTAAALGDPGRPGWWDWSDTKIALEALFWQGRITTAWREGFTRVYDLAERVFPEAVLAAPTPPRQQAIRTLALRAVQAQGVASPACVKAYWRLPPAEADAALAALVEAGAIDPVTITGRAGVWFVARDRPPGRARATAVLSPFDPLVWTRDRIDALFDFHYRLEFYVPAAKRRYGYYVMPFLYRGRLVGRVDVRADRGSGVLQVGPPHWEPHATPGTTPDAEEALRHELTGLATWLDLAPRFTHA